MCVHIPPVHCRIIKSMLLSKRQIDLAAFDTASQKASETGLEFFFVLFETL